jgi:hypothetical protein
VDFLTGRFRKSDYAYIQEISKLSSIEGELWLYFNSLFLGITKMQITGFGKTGPM